MAREEAWTKRPRRIVQIAAGRYALYALADDGTAWTFASDDGSHPPIWYPVPKLPDVEVERPLDMVPGPGATTRGG